MITAEKLQQLQNIGADQMTNLMSDCGYDVTSEPFLNTHFEGVTTGTDNKVNFLYCGMYYDIHVTCAIQYAHLIVSFDLTTGKTSVDYAA
jgi:hypothetical protein